MRATRSQAPPGLPAGWVEEVSRELRPDAFAPGTHGRGLHVALTYRTELPDLLEQRGDTLQAVVTDLTAGFTIEPRTDGARESYRLVGSRFAVTVSQLPGTEPGRTIAVVGSVDPVDGATRADLDQGVLIEASVSFHLPYEEVAYDVANLHAITEETEGRRQAARDQAARLLTDPAATDTGPSALRERLRDRYAGTALLLDLLGAGFEPQRDVLTRLLDDPLTPDIEPLARLLDDPAALPAESGTLPGPRVLPDTGTETAPRLDPAQAGAVSGAVSARHVFAVSGPPEATGEVVVETVRQLVARGERVLLMTATRDAGDATLRRVGTQPGIFALRAPGDDPVPEDLRRLAPATLPDHLTRLARRPDTAYAPRWGQHIARLTAERDLLRRHLAARHRLATARTRSHEAIKALEAWENSYQEHRQACATRVRDLEAQLAAATADLAPTREAEQHTAEALRAARADRAFTDRLAGLVRTGETARTARDHRRAVKARKSADARHETLSVQLHEAQEQLREVIRQGPPQREQHERACAQQARAVAETRREVAASTEPVRSLLAPPPSGEQGETSTAGTEGEASPGPSAGASARDGTPPAADARPATGEGTAELTDAVIDGHARRREAHIARLRRYIDLERRWFELTGPSAGGPELGDQLVRAANLVCCTYADTGFLAAAPVAGSGGLPQAHQASGPGTGPTEAGGPHATGPTTGVTAARRAAPDFDTLIVDQAARLRDSEFLVGAVRARRWILVGDDSDPAPPIRLGTADEHELLAVAALTAEPAADPASTIADMTVTTRPPEGLPTEGVRAAARRLRADQSRTAGHEAAITAARARTPDPAAALVRAVHGHRMPDFFTARLSGLPAALRRRFSAPGEGE